MRTERRTCCRPSSATGSSHLTTTYWQGAAWNVSIHDPFSQPEDFIKPKFEYCRHLQSFLSTIGYGRFRPYPEGSGSGYCLKSDNGSYLFYLPKQNYQISVPQRFIRAAEGRTLQWFNTITGEYSAKPDCHGGPFKSPWCAVADSILIMELS